ncbi:Protein Jade-1 [Liparis tanakae]|uniref:Protein Jade-1 n=1 Tax=Liparis tanakae TaxID=230148 RepID=A0A4Z2E8Q2_9TELE|nr:Protein Jade-1 [Liparis tanakae]
MPSCIVAFHVTCAFDRGAEMRTVLADNDEVRFKSFCLDHSGRPERGAAHAAAHAAVHAHAAAHAVAHAHAAHAAHVAHAHAHAAGGEQRAEREQLERDAVGQRKQKLQQLEDEFYRLVDPREVAQSLALPGPQVDFLYQFWKTKRKANFNRPLVTLKRDEVDDLAQQEQDVLYRRLQLFTHLRQDLERVSVCVCVYM